jgi:GT2 family glycosyltransferase
VVNARVGEGMGISAVIVSWNAAELLRECLRSVYATTRDYSLEVIVVDNDSVDGSPKMVTEEFKEATLISTGANLGFSKANNIGIKKGSGRYVCLVNSDVRILDHCVDRLCKYMDEHPSVGLIGPQILNRDMSIQVSCYGFPNVLNTVLHALGLNKVMHKCTAFGCLYEKYWPYERTRRVDVLSGCFWIARREAIETVGLLDESFFFAWEDFDWCKRFHNAGWDVVYSTDSQVIHYGRGSSRNAASRFAVEVERAHIQYWKKYYRRSGVLFVSVMILLRNCLQAWKHALEYFLTSSDRSEARERLECNLSVLRWLTSLRRDRHNKLPP